MTWVLTAVFCIILVEFVARIPISIVVSEITLVSRKALHTLGAKSVSDHWKEKVILAYAISLFTSTLKLAFFIGVIATISISFIYAGEYIGVALSDFIVSWYGVLYSIVMATVYFRVRKHFVER